MIKRYGMGCLLGCWLMSPWTVFQWAHGASSEPMAALVALLAICDLVFNFPFSGTTDGAQHVRMMDILFIVAAAIIGYLAYDSYKDLR